MEKQGIIIKGISGFYYVKTDDSEYECKARGVFRKDGITPLVGDKVLISVNENSENIIEEIKERKNCISRPPVSNIDQIIIVASTESPGPNCFVIDTMTAIAVKNNIKPVIVINKTDLKSAEELFEIYKTTGFNIFSVCAKTGENVDLLKNIIDGKLSAITGNSGVGKSTILNCLEPKLNLKSAEISKKLNRGKHTTRECTLLSVGNGYVIDTPGFGTLQGNPESIIDCDELQYCFPEFEPYIEDCRFYPGCAHIKDKGCAVIKAVEEGIISESRHNSYVNLYLESNKIPDWKK